MATPGIERQRKYLEANNKKIISITVSKEDFLVLRRLSRYHNLPMAALVAEWANNFEKKLIEQLTEDQQREYQKDL